MIIAAIVKSPWTINHKVGNPVSRSFTKSDIVDAVNNTSLKIIQYIKILGPNKKANIKPIKIVNNNIVLTPLILPRS